MQENKAVKMSKSPVAFHVFAFMLLVTLISSHVIAGTIAKYVSRGSSADSARVASFSVSAAGENDAPLSLDYGGSASYTLTVTNDSEVDVGYQVFISFNGDVTGTLGVTLTTAAGTELSATPADGAYNSTENKTVFTFTNTGFNLNVDDNASYSITISAKSGFLPGAGDNGKTKSVDYGFETQVLFEQKD